MVSRSPVKLYSGDGSHTLGELLQRQSPEEEIVLDVDEPPPAFLLSFTDLNYAVKARWKGIVPDWCFGKSSSSSQLPKVLLNGISGEAREGEITAVLGGSGSGKSTLIDALAGRICRKSLAGSVKLNGEALESGLLKTISAYVMQDDLLFPMLTVEETLTFAAEFRLPKAMSKSQKKSRVNALMQRLGLLAAANTIIGDEGRRGVSGGERRRVSIGTDIIHDPIVLFLDEPTSGLDSTSAFMVVKVLKTVAQSGSVVIMSIHQPSYRIVRLLDHLIILSRGQTVFSDSPASIPVFFAEFGNPIPADEDKIEFALDLIRELENSGGAGTENLRDFNRNWNRKKSKKKKKKKKKSDAIDKILLKDAIKAASISKGKLLSGASDKKFQNPIWKEILIIGNRSLTISRRSPELFFTRFAAVIVTGTILATVYRRLDDSPRGIQERLGFFAFAMSTTFYTCAESMPIFLLERYIFLRETSHHSYRRSSYVLSHAAASVPPLAVLSLSFAATIFWAVGLSGGARGFLFFSGSMMAAFWAGTSFVTFLSGVIADLLMSYTVVAAVLGYWVLFSGFFVGRDRIPGYWTWFHYLSLVKYPFQGVVQNEFDRPYKCFVRGVEVFDQSPLRLVPESVKVKLLESVGSTLGMNITASTCLITGSDVLKQAGVTDIGKWDCLWITVCWGFFFRLLFYFALLIRSNNNKRT
ncbi:abc transporter family protein [Genlisea aurea]|uniref:Abc transporter family protein n=1 Tax=Genlisea aurea TaxID=192259 RepID=S8CK52_9LAMI|nr:abc transporter family protein [Genlisea aurea]